MSKYALMLNASTGDVGPAANEIEYALDLDDAGPEVEEREEAFEDWLKRYRPRL